MLKERYEICDVLDQIGDRIIYEGKDKILGRDVVIQEFYPVELVYRFGENLRIDAYKGRTEKLCIRRERFCKEAKVLERFKKLDGLVTPIDFFEANNTAYTIMRHLGETITLGKLSKIMREYKMIDVIVLLECLLPVMNGIAALHREGLLHCDINPSSIIVLNDCTMKLLVDAGKRLIKDPMHIMLRKYIQQKKKWVHGQIFMLYVGQCIITSVDIIHSKHKIVSLKRRL